MTQQEILAGAESCGRQIDEIIVHCSATREGRDFSAADIRRWHVADRHFSDIGYHFVVRIDGSIEAGRPLRRPGAHCRAHNRRSVGVCYIGGLDRNGHPADTRTPARAAIRRTRRAGASAAASVPVRGAVFHGAYVCGLSLSPSSPWQPPYLP